jgi:cold shock CspA family protein
MGEPGGAEVSGVIRQRLAYAYIIRLSDGTDAFLRFRDISQSLIEGKEYTFEVIRVREDGRVFVRPVA